MNLTLMLKNLLNGLDLGIFSLISMVLALAMFAAILLWACCRSREQIEADSRLWMDDEN